MKQLLVKNIGLLATPTGSHAKCGEAQGQISYVKNAALLIENGVIVDIYENGELPEVIPENVFDAGGRLATPGLIDSHTHAVFGGWRQHEVPLKLKGASYLEILAAGGGILNTLTTTRDASEDELFARTQGFLDEMLGFGVTTLEVKSGYGLDLDTELKQLRVIKSLNNAHKMDLVPTFLGAHAVPSDYKGNASGFIDYLCENVLPSVVAEKLADFCDVFLEEGVFDVAQSRKMLLAAKAQGLGLKIHADEIYELGGTALANEVGAISAEHLIATGDGGMEQLKQGGCIAVLLPQTSLYLNKEFANARGMIAHGVPVALATDFNPGSCPSLNLQLSMNLGYLKYRMTPEEVLTAVTLNAAAAIGKASLVGTIEVGKQADIAIFDVCDLSMLCYRMGSNQIYSVIKKGEIVI